MAKTLEELAAALPAPAETPRKKQAKPAPAPSTKSSPDGAKRAKTSTWDAASPAERRQDNVEKFAAGFQAVNEGLAAKLDDDYYMVSDTEALIWGQHVSDTMDWAGVGNVPPPVNLLAYTLALYIPRAFHFWVHGREAGYEPGREEYASENGHLEDVAPGPPPWRQAEA